MSWPSILRELDYPNIFLVSLDQFERVAGWRPDENFPGGNDRKHRIIAVTKGRTAHYRDNCLWHEVLHFANPNAEEWYIEACAEKCARGGGRGEYCKAQGKTLNDVPPRAAIIETLKRRLNRQKGKGAGARPN